MKHPLRLVIGLWSAALILSMAGMVLAAARPNACDVARATLPKAVQL